MPKVTVSIVTYNGAKYITECLDSVVKQTHKNIEIVIWDNASKDDTVKKAKKKAPKAKIIEYGENIGFGAGHNEVIKQAKGDYILVLNQDLILEPDYIQENIVKLEKNEHLGSTQGLLLRCRSLTLTNCRNSDKIDSAGLQIRKSHNVKDQGQNKRKKDVKLTRSIFGPSGAAAMYRKTALDDVAHSNDKVFDTSFFMYKEDIDLAYRLALRGWKSELVLEAKGYHVRTKASKYKRPSAQVNYWSYRNHWYTIIKNTPHDIWTAYAVWIIAYELAKLGFLILFEQSTLPALAEVWRTRHAYYKKREEIQKRITLSRGELHKLYI